MSTSSLRLRTAGSMSGQQFLTAVAILFFVTHRPGVPLLYRPYGSCNGSSINSSLTAGVECRLALPHMPVSVVVRAPLAMTPYILM